jgi:phage terminase large subunit
MQIKLSDSAYSSKFYSILHSWDRYIISYGSRGSSKTDTFYLKYLLSLFEPYYFKLAYINKEGSNIRDQQYAGFKRVAKRIGLYDKLKFYDGDYRVVNPKGENMLIPKGMDDPEKTKGLDDITAIWWDEANKGTIDDFRALNELLRSPMAMYLQFALSFNPVMLEHWLRHTFFHPDDPHVLHPDFKHNTLLHRSTFRDNEFIDQEAYYQTLIQSAAGNKNAIRVNVEGDWGLEENDSPWLYNFDEDKHIGDLQFLPTYDVYLSFDFNRDPVTCTAWQMTPNAHLGTTDSFVHCIKEFKEKMQLSELCQLIKITYPRSTFYVTGDRTGKQGDVGFEDRHATYYTMIQKLLRVPDRLMNIEGKNMEHNDSRMLCNAVLYHHPCFKISKDCKNLISECIRATVDEKKAKAGVLLKDRVNYKMDLFDGFRYFNQTYFEAYATKMMAI